MGFLKEWWLRYRENWIVHSFAIVGFFAILAEIWPLTMMLNPYLALATVLWYNNVITFFGGGLLLVTGVIYLRRGLKRLFF